MADHAEFAAETERVRNLLNPKPEELKTPKRFIKEGPCIVQEVKHSEHESYLFLFNNVLFVTRKEKDKYKIFIAMTMRSSLKIEDYSTSGADDELATSPNFIIDAGKRKFIFKLEDAEQKDDWKREISAAIEGEYELDVIKPVFREVDGKNVWDVRAGLNPEQLNLLDQFHAKVAARDPALDDELRAWADDACLCRFLRARQWNLQDAYIMIDNTLNWRATERPQDIKYEEVFHAANGDLYISPCRDKNGRIIVYMRPGRSPDDPNVRKQYVRYMSWLMETGTRLLDTPHTAQEKMIWIVDFADSKIQGGMEDNIRLSRETINVMQNHYPERLGVGFILNPPLPFYVLWKIVSGFVDPVTNRKINFLKNKKHFHTLLHYINADQLEEPYGGTNKFVFTADEWKNTYFPGAGGEASGSA